MTGALLLDKVAVITGAAAGIGRATALEFARQGAVTVLADIDVNGGKETVDLIESAGGQSLFRPADVSSTQDVAALIEGVLQHFGKLDCAVNNAGIDGAHALLAESTEDNWDQVVGVNLKGVWLCLKYEIPPMLAGGAGSIVNISSVAGLVGVDLGVSAYTAAKHGVIGLTRAAALEYATRGIRVNAICPGGVRTTLLERAIANGLITEEQASALQPVGRLGKPEEIARTIAWLCSESASFITGHAMAVDGGYTAR
jgi:NAD(P)-dependent dehydrogenase (short-subunit alcohol dehydrogenase family)